MAEAVDISKRQLPVKLRDGVTILDIKKYPPFFFERPQQCLDQKNICDLQAAIRPWSRRMADHRDAQHRTPHYGEPYLHGSEI